MRVLDAVCSSCGGKMLMYYAPYCPACTPKAKLKKNLIQSIDYIEHKYKIETRDYAAAKQGAGDGSSISFNVEHEAGSQVSKEKPIFILASFQSLSTSLI